MRFVLMLVLLTASIRAGAPAIDFDVSYLATDPGGVYAANGFSLDDVVTIKPSGSYWSEDELNAAEFEIVTLQLSLRKLEVLQSKTFDFRLNANQTQLLANNPTANNKLNDAEALDNLEPSATATLTLTPTITPTLTITPTATEVIELPLTPQITVTPDLGEIEALAKKGTTR